MIKNKKLIVIIICLLCLGLIFFRLLSKNNLKVLVGNYLEKEDFQKVDDNNYYKQISETTEEEYFEAKDNGINSITSHFYFDTENFILTKVIMEYDDDISYTYTGVYNYGTKEIDYVYDIDSGKAIVTLKGIYDKENNIFTCDTEYLNNIVLEEDDNKEILCKKVNLENESFFYEMIDIIDNPNLINKIEKEIAK